MVDLIYNDIIVLDDVSRETFDTVTASAIDIEPYASYSPYYATLNEPYLSYMQAYVAALAVSEHYVVYLSQETRYVNGANRTSTVYNFAHGTLDYTGNFVGDVQIDKIYAQTAYFPQFAVVKDSNFTLIPGNALVYTDLESAYPDLGAPHNPQKWIFFILIFMLLLLVLKKLFRK